MQLLKQSSLLYLLGTLLLGSKLQSRRTPPATFHLEEFLASHSPHPPHSSNPNATTRVHRVHRIPRIIHQSYISLPLLYEHHPEWAATPDRWQSIHNATFDDPNEHDPNNPNDPNAQHDPNNPTEQYESYRYLFWSDAQNLHLISTHYPWFLPTYLSYPYPIQRADAARYFAVLHYGGVYADLDILPRGRVDGLLDLLDLVEDVDYAEDNMPEMIVAETYNLGLTNALFASVPNSTLLTQFVHELPFHRHPLSAPLASLGLFLSSFWSGGGDGGDSSDGGGDPNGIAGDVNSPCPPHLNNSYPTLPPYLSWIDTLLETTIAHFAILLSTGPTRLWIFLNQNDPRRERIVTLPPGGWGQCHQCLQGHRGHEGHQGLQQRKQKQQEKKKQESETCTPQPDSFFETVRGGSWHRWDTNAFNFIFCHGHFVVWFGICAICAICRLSNWRSVRCGCGGCSWGGCRGCKGCRRCCNDCRRNCKDCRECCQSCRSGRELDHSERRRKTSVELRSLRYVTSSSLDPEECGESNENDEHYENYESDPRTMDRDGNSSEYRGLLNIAKKDANGFRKSKKISNDLKFNDSNHYDKNGSAQKRQRSLWSRWTQWTRWTRWRSWVFHSSGWSVLGSCDNIVFLTRRMVLQYHLSIFCLIIWFLVF